MISACYQLVARDSALTISEPQRVFGRFDFINLASAEDADLISRQHFSIKFEERKFYVQDVGSKNGTKINYGEDIRGRGWLEIKPNDVISVAGVLDLKFMIVEATKCSFCDYPNKPDAVFCEHCGRPLKPEAVGGGDIPRAPPL